MKSREKPTCRKEEKVILFYAYAKDHFACAANGVKLSWLSIHRGDCARRPHALNLTQSKSVDHCFIMLQEDAHFLKLRTRRQRKKKLDREEDRPKEGDLSAEEHPLVGTRLQDRQESGARSSC